MACSPARLPFPPSNLVITHFLTTRLVISYLQVFLKHPRALPTSQRTYLKADYFRLQAVDAIWVQAHHGIGVLHVELINSQDEINDTVS